MGCNLLHIEHFQPMTRGHGIDRDQREVREVLVIDRVELVLVDELLEMRKLEGDDALRRANAPCGNEVVKVWHLRQHVVADDQVGALAFRGQTLRRAQVQKNSTSVGTFFLRATSATLAAGSMPVTGTPSGRKC